MKKIVSICIIFFLFLFAGVGASFAQSLTPQTLQQNFDVSVNPKYPGPEEFLNITLHNFSLETDDLRFEWSLDGISRDSGLGENSFGFTTGAIGSVHRVSVSISGSGIFTTKNYTFTVGSVDLLVEPLSYTPPFYKGAKLPSENSDIRIFAVNNIPNADQGSLYYTWKRDGRILENQSGFGRSSLLLEQSDILREKEIEVLVGPNSNTVITTNSVVINPNENQTILLYEDNPLYGVLYNQALDVVRLDSPEITLRAEPYFFSSTGFQYPFLDFSWRLNRNTLANTGNSITLRRDTTDNNNQAALQINTESRFSNLETATKNISVEY